MATEKSIRNDKVLCRILNYVAQERKFEIEVCSSHTKGYVIFKNHYDDIPKMRTVLLKDGVIPLYFDKYVDGIAYFSYRSICFDKREDTYKDENTSKIVISFSNQDSERNTFLFEALYKMLGECIDTEEKYSLAKQLLEINRKFKFRKGLTKDFFKLSNGLYQSKFWKEGLLPYFSNLGIKNAWAISTDEEKDTILQRLGITYPKAEPTLIQPFFENIGEEVLKTIRNAVSSIHVAMAWFTNYDIFKVLKEKLVAGIEITMVTNNDLINNGGYCLNLNELINAGLVLYLAEYPDLIHHKFCIVDNEIVMNGSYNWTFFSEVVNRENMVVIKDDENVVKLFNEEFDKLTNKYPSVTQMPEVVPERPEYDRSSFKQYISEELVIRTKRHIGNTRDNLLHAHTLSPNNPAVKEALSDFNVNVDNTDLSISEIEDDANRKAIQQRQEYIGDLTHQDKRLDNRQKTLQRKNEQIQAEISTQTQQEDINRLVSEHEKISSEISDVEQERERICQEVSTTQEEINIIQKTSQIETKGGRGALKVNLKWNTFDDLDLHIIDPDGYEIYYSQKQHICQNVLGQLDLDANAGSPLTKTPQENIYWEQDKSAPLGHYKVFVVYYSKKDTQPNVPFSVTVYPGKGEYKVFTGNVHNANDKFDVVEFDYNEEGISYNL